jgi:hypothetical protein
MIEDINLIGSAYDYFKRNFFLSFRNDFHVNNKTWYSGLFCKYKPLQLGEYLENVRYGHINVKQIILDSIVLQAFPI